MPLVDGSVWLEQLLEQERSEEVRLFLERTPSNLLHITDFAFHSICLILTRLGRPDAVLRFVDDLFVTGDVVLVRLAAEDMPAVLDAMAAFRLDFDDAYQCVAADLLDLTLVSFDSDFDRTARGRSTPAEVTPQ